MEAGVRAMTGRRVEVGHLSPYSVSSQAPLFWGMIGVITIEGMILSCLVATYFFMRMGQPEWPPDGIKEPDLLLPTIGTVILLASSIPVHWGDKAIVHGNQERLWKGMVLGTVLAIVFLSIKAVEYSGLEYRWDSHAYGSIVWGISSFHALHVIALVLKTSVVSTLSWRGYFNRERRMGVVVNGIYWHFVVVAWIPLYLVLYWAPRL